MTYAATSTWNLSTNTEYTYDSAKIEFADESGTTVARLKGTTFSATGGTITTSGAYTLHTFTASDTFTPNGSTNVEVLVVAGGGSGGGSTAGGGGAGGLIYNASYGVTSSAITVTVGDGGSQAMEQTTGNNGQNSVFGSLTAIGGGGGGFTSAATNGGPGLDGGSGGGGARYGAKVNARGLGTSGQGNDGGTYGTDTYPGGGGGGAGAVGAAPTASKSGNGGDGLSYSISGSLVYYAGGGGGGSQSSGGNGGQGGGGAGTSNGTTGTAGTTNTGGGGGGGWYYSGGRGGAGGSGIVIARYLTNTNFYATDNPTLVPNTGQGYSSVSGFTQTLGSGSVGNLQYQVSADSGTTYYYWTGSAWASASGYAQSNTAADVNTNLATFTAGTNPKTFKWKAYFNSDGSQLPKLDNLNLTYIWDTVAPDNPASVTATSSNGGSAITTNTWYNYASPYFTWTAPTDNAGAGETVSGVAGYYVYFGTDNTADPLTAGTYQTASTYTASSLTTGSTYYLRMKTKDAAGNTNATAVGLFTYKYDSSNPTNPSYVTAIPSGYNRTKDFSFTYPITGGSAAADTGSSDVKGYQYRIGVSGTWYGTTHDGSQAVTDYVDVNTGTIALTSADQNNISTGANVFQLRTLDTAGNFSTANVQTTFYYSGSAPSAPQSLVVTPTSSTTNSFAFSWSAPATFNGSIADYRYSINVLPTSTNTTSNGTATTIEAGAYASQQGENTFYIVAKDDAANVNYTDYTTVTFTANTAAPGQPLNTAVYDISNKETKEYAVSLKWSTPTSTGIGFSGYNIYRSSDNSTFASVGTTTGTSYVDAGLSSEKYYYYVKSKDDANQFSAASSTVFITPTGKWTSAPTIETAVAVSVKTTSTTITWKTDSTTDASGRKHTTSSFVKYGKTESFGSTTGALDQVTDHSVVLLGLSPLTVYYYQITGVDIDGNELTDTTRTFTTNALAKITDVSAEDLRQTTVIISWKTTKSVDTYVVYGETTNYGGSSDSSTSTTHTTRLSGLKDGTTYHYSIVGVDDENNTLSGEDHTLITPAFPRVSEVSFEPIKDAATTTIKMSWVTNVPTDSVVAYSSSSGSKEVGTADLTTSHSLTIDRLQDKTSYIFQAKGRDQYGNEAISDIQNYATPIDTRPPQITNVLEESSIIGVGDTAKAQLVISWDTDELSTSQIKYGVGVGGEYGLQTGEDTALTTSHLVIISNLLPSNTYHFQAVSKDATDNSTSSGDNTIITGTASKSAVQLVIRSLQDSLGFLSIFKQFFGDR